MKKQTCLGRQEWAVHIFMIFFFHVGGSFPKMWEISECMDRSGRGGVRGLPPAASHSGLVLRLIASICLFSVVC